MEKGLISVDEWREGSQAYFLTHLHADHIKGLSSTWAKAPIFCSRITAKLFPFKFPNFNLSLLHVLDLGSWHSLSLLSPSSASEVTVQVMAIDAHHCPGAVMFLFRGESGCTLNTGDFRWEINSERAKLGREMLLNALQHDKVDALYLDNTYCNPSYQFPPREVAAQQIVDLITSHPDHDIVIGINTLGKEDLLLHISKALNIKIWVWPERLQTMHLLGYHDIFTTDTSLTRVRAIPRYSFSINTLEGLNTMHPTIGIIPSGLPWIAKPLERDGRLFDSLLTSRYNRSKVSSRGGKKNDKTHGNLGSVERFHKYIYSVQYSDHSSYPELEEFIKLVQPTNMKGIVTTSPCYVDPLYYFGRICGINQPSQKLHRQHQMFGKGYIGIENKRKRVDRLGFHSIRERVIRRTVRGVKLDEYDGSD
ncbi:DNA repair metallo-beta-lactamase family protein isoform 4 [Hibiscus syriacus]|uniref:Protein artemis n=1 Tax=Hibiscus syriacus TaxID=106335 RepID=A0A6A3D786_HIBSY|nr:5' exonuclease Apollo [Hibiscus syriacus]KAE8735798.1 DNA repair metallo-beta-lactamase family protein isoform 4 [Hibiscus syriacus]